MPVAEMTSQFRGAIFGAAYSLDAKREINLPAFEGFMGVGNCKDISFLNELFRLYIADDRRGMREALRLRFGYPMPAR